MKLYSFWLGSNPLSAARESALATLGNTGLEVTFLRRDDLGRYINESDLHPAFAYLSDNHKSDYLRAMFMHRFGGGYADIKWIEHSWLPEVRRLERSERLIASGYPETDPSHVANNHLCAQLLGAGRRVRWRKRLEYGWLRHHYRRLIGNGAFIFKPRTEFTSRWWAEVNRRLDVFHADLVARPARYPREGKGLVIDGQVSTYPIPWIYLCGSIVHPLALRHHSAISQGLPPLIYRTAAHATYI